jgi:hypothetical protein
VVSRHVSDAAAQVQRLECPRPAIEEGELTVPFYAGNIPAGSLTDHQKENLARAITRTPAEVTGGSSDIVIAGHIGAGRSDADKQRILRALESQLSRLLALPAKARPPKSDLRARIPASGKPRVPVAVTRNGRLPRRQSTAASGRVRAVICEYLSAYELEDARGGRSVRAGDEGPSVPIIVEPLKQPTEVPAPPAPQEPVRQPEKVPA